MGFRQALGIGDKVFYRQLFSIAIPIMIQQLINTAMYMVDTMMVGGLGKIPLASLGAANSITILLDMIILGLVSGATVFEAQFWGKRDEKGVQSVLGLTIILTVIGTSLFLLIAQIRPDWLVRLFVDDEAVVETGARYIKIASFGYPLKAVVMSYSMANRCSGKAVMPMLSGFAGLCVNIVLNYMLIYGHCGLPALGVEGAAIATFVGMVVNAITLVLLSNVKKTAAQGSPKALFSHCFDNFAGRMRVILPVLADDLVWGIGSSIISAIYGHMGTDAFAAITIFFTMDKLTYVVLVSAGNACGVTLGNYIGAGEPERAREYSHRYGRLMLLSGVVLGLLVILLGAFVPNFYDVSPEVRRLASYTIAAMGVMIALIGYNFVVTLGTLRSGGDTLAAALIDVLPLWLVQIPLMALLGLYFELPLYIVYLAVVPTEILRLLMGRHRIKKNKWLRNVTQEG